MFLRSLFIIAIFFSVVSCATKQDKELTQRIEQAPIATSEQEVRNSFAEGVQNLQHLTDEQKSKLLAIHEKTAEEIKKLDEERLKIQQVLVEEFSKPEISPTMIKSAKKRMTRNSQDRLKTVFKEMDEASQIIKGTQRNPELMNQIYIDHFGRRK